MSEHKKLARLAARVVYAQTHALERREAAALKAGGNTIVGYDIQYTNVIFNSKEHVIVSVSGTSVETA